MQNYKLPHFQAFTKQDFPNALPEGNYKNIPISLTFEAFADFENNVEVISHFLENLEQIFADIQDYVLKNPSDIGDFYTYLQHSNQLADYQAYIEDIKVKRIAIYCFDELTFHISLAFKEMEMGVYLFKDLANFNVYVDWGGYSIKKSAMIAYPPEKLQDFACTTYEYIDNLNFLLDPYDCLDNVEDYLEVASQRFLEEGWDGDGLIKLLWIPPFMLKDEFGEAVYFEHEEGIIVWHVKQLSDGISYLLLPKDLDQQIWGADSYREPIVIKELGQINGRDAIYLDDINFTGYSLVLQGTVEGSLCENIGQDKAIPYTISFKNVLDFSSTEVDFYDCRRMRCNFERYANSQKIAEFKQHNNPKLTENHQHFVFYTYDLVFEIVASEFELVLA